MTFPFPAFDPKVGGDPHFDSVAFLLHCDGADGATTFTDSGPDGVTVTAAGNAQIDTDQSKFGGASGLFDGTGDYLSIPDAAKLDLSSGDWTFEAWVRFTSSISGAPLIFGQKTDGNNGIEMGFQFGSTRGMTLNIVAAGSYALNLTQGANTGWSADTWYHIAWEKDGTTYRGYRDGSVVMTTTSAALPANYTGAFIIGGGSQISLTGVHSPSSDLTGRLDDIRGTPGVARYGGAFTPPTEAFPDN